MQVVLVKLCIASDVALAVPEVKSAKERVKPIVVEDSTRGAARAVDLPKSPMVT